MEKIQTNVFQPQRWLRIFTKKKNGIRFENVKLVRLADLEDLKRSLPRTWKLNISRQRNTNMGFCQQDFINTLKDKRAV